MITHPKICIIGLGYVGLPLAIAFAEKYPVTGFDISQPRIKDLRQNNDCLREVSHQQLAQTADNIHYTTDINDCADSNIYIVTVPTPIDEAHRPDLRPLLQASQSLARVIDNNNIVIYESTVYPGVTEDICIPEIERISGLVYNKDFFAGYSPERINPGDQKRGVKQIIKVTSGSTPAITDFVDKLYGSIIEAGTHKVSSIKVAEAAKVIENTQRDVNIALINELALIFDQMQIDTQEVLAAAATKWNFIHLTPGLVGGHCIGVDPYYLTFKAEELGYKPNLILSSRLINNGMAKFIAEKTIKLMILADKKIKQANILILGMTFKEDCQDMRNTKVVDIIDELHTYQTQVQVYDPLLDQNSKAHPYFQYLIDNPLMQDKQYDAIIVAVAHRQFKDWSMSDYLKLCRKEPVIIDIKGIVPEPSWRL